MLRYCGNNRNEDRQRQMELTVRFSAPDFWDSRDFCRQVGIRLGSKGDNGGVVQFRELRAATLDQDISDSANRHEQETWERGNSSQLSGEEAVCSRYGPHTLQHGA